MNKCSCYRETQGSKTTYKRAVCFGTKELDECSCGGDRAKCDFYQYVRDEANHVADYRKSVMDWTLAECVSECQSTRSIQPDCCDEACRLAEYGVCCKDWDLELRKKNIKAAIAHYTTGINEDIFSPEVATYAKLAVEALEKMNG